MKTILEVLECSNGELKFNTDVDVIKDPEAIIDITGRAIFYMATKLWGGNEHSVIAMIRSMFMADMALSPERDRICKRMATDSKAMYKIFKKTLSQCGDVRSFPPGITPNMKGRKN